MQVLEAREHKSVSEAVHVVSSRQAPLRRSSVTINVIAPFVRLPSEWQGRLSRVQVEELEAQVGPERLDCRARRRTHNF